MEEIRLSPDNNSYIIRGHAYPRMTHVMATLPKPHLDRWRERVGDEEADRISRETGDAGSLVHLVTELYDRNDIPQIKTLTTQHSWLTPYLFVWAEWRERYTTRIALIETTVWSERLGIAGRLDRLLVMTGDDTTTVADVKTTKSLSDDIGIQLCGYREMVIEMIERGELPDWMRPERTIACHLPGPRDDDEQTGRVLERVRVREYRPDDYKQALLDCVTQYYALKG